MLIKWVVCKVPSEKKTAFSEAQSKWNAISSAPGLIGQLGGWDEKNPGTACILCLWEDQFSFDNFMANIHDSVADNNDQLSTFSDIEVTFFDPNMKMPGEYEDLVGAIPRAKILRVADCQVKEENISHFMDAQRSVWVPAMSKSNGMLGGNFSRVENDGRRFLVTTLWVSEESHGQYAETQVPRLRETADVSGDLISIIGRFIHLEPSWQVLP